MSEESPKPNPPDDKPERLKLEDVVTPIFDLAMGQRLQLARMQRLWDQSELAERLNSNKHTISDLETGKLAVPRAPFTLAKLEEVFGPTATKFIVLNRSSAFYAAEAGRIRNKYWERKLAERKPREKSQHWTAKRLAEGKPIRGTFQGIPASLWNRALELQNKSTQSIKRRGKKTEG